MRRSLLAATLFGAVSLTATAFAQNAPAPGTAPAAPGQTGQPAQPAQTVPPAQIAPPGQSGQPESNQSAPGQPATGATSGADNSAAAGTDSANQSGSGSTDQTMPKSSMHHMKASGGKMSGGASNLTEADTRGDIAPRLPSPKLGPDASARDYLMAAREALQQNRTGEAQQALEMAETRALDRSTDPSRADMPDQAPMVKQIHDALTALGNKDRSGAMAAIAQVAGNDSGDSSGGMHHRMHHRMHMKQNGGMNQGDQGTQGSDGQSGGQSGQGDMNQGSSSPNG